MPVKEYINIAFEVHAKRIPSVPSHFMVLSASTFDSDLCNNLFEIDHQCQLTSQGDASRMSNAINMINRTTMKWHTTVKQLWLQNLNKKERKDLFFSLTAYEPKENDLMNVAPSKQRFLFSVLSMQPPPPPAAAPVLPSSADAIPVTVASTAPMTAKEAAVHQHRTTARALMSENHKQVTYDDGSAVPSTAWHVVFPLFVNPENENEEPKLLFTDILDQTRAQQLMNQRTLDDSQVDMLVKSIWDTPGLVALPEKMGVLICERAYNRLNDRSFVGDIYDGLTDEEKSFPRDPVQAVLTGERKLIIIAGNHTTIAQLKVIKKAIADGT